MGNETSTIVLQVDSTGVRRANTDLDTFAAKGKKAETTTVGLSTAMRSLTAVVSAGAVAALAKQALQTADAYSNMTSRLSLVTSNTRELVAVQKALFDVSQNTRVDLAETTTLYTRLASSTEALGASQKEVIGVTEAINKALVISGTSAASAQAALVQLGQAFASGTLRGEELNSVLEQAPRLARAIADGLGVPIGKLRQMGADGEITAEKLFRALQKSGAALTAEFEKMPETVGGATTRVSNSITQLIGTIDKLTGTSSSVAGWATQTSAALDRINARVAKSGGVWQGYFDALESGWASARLQATREAMERMAGAVRDANAALAENPKNPYAKDTLREFSELEQAARGYEATIKRIQGLDASKPAAGSQGGRARDRSERTIANVAASIAREESQLAAHQAFLKEHATAEEKYTAALKAEKEKQGSYFTADMEKRLRDKFFPKKPKELDFLKGDIGEVQRALDLVTNTYANAERVLEATRQAGLISEKDYYTEKLGLLKLNTDAQVAALEAENAAIEERSRTGQKGLDDDRKKADNLAQISILQERAAASAQVMGFEQTGAANKAKLAYDEAAAAAKNYLATVSQQNAREIATYTLGDKARGRAREMSGIEDKFQGQINDAYADNRRGQLPDDGLQTRLADLQQLKDAEIRLAEEKYRALDALDQSWQAGLSTSVQKYLEDAANVSKQVQGVVGTATKGMENAFVEFVMTGKTSFKDLANSVIAELLRMQAQAAITAIFQALMGGGGGGAGAGGGWGALIGSIFSSASGRAIGGPVSAGSMYQVNERGPELLNVGNKQYLLTGSQGGAVSPNGGKPATVNNYNVAAGVQRNEMVSALQLLAQSMRAETDQKLRKNGMNT